MILLMIDQFFTVQQLQTVTVNAEATRPLRDQVDLRKFTYHSAVFSPFANLY